MSPGFNTPYWLSNSFLAISIAPGGNISSTVWNYSNRISGTDSYTYDSISRLKSAAQTSRFAQMCFNETYGYDRNGCTIAYNLLNLPYAVTTDDDVTVSSYLANGTRLSNGDRMYYGNLIVDSGTASKVLFDGGYIDLTFGARHLLPSIASWTTMDPLAEQYYSTSPYSYCSANPINRVDPDGNSWFYSELDGSFLHMIEDEDDRIFMLNEAQVSEARDNVEAYKLHKEQYSLFGDSKVLA